MLIFLSPVGMLHGMVGFLVDVVCCRFKMGMYRPLKVSEHIVVNLVDIIFDR